MKKNFFLVSVVNKRQMKIIVAFFIIFTMYSLKVDAKNIDMQKVNPEVKKPVASFMIETMNSSGEIKRIYSDSNYYNSDKYSFDIKAPKIKLPYGTKINIKNLSIPGDGSRISTIDFQIYTPKGEELYSGNDMSKLNRIMTLDEAGDYSFYLSVMDNAKNVSGYDNWSVNGNHRWLTKKPNDNNDMYYWYFTQIDIEVMKKGEDTIVDESDNKEDDDGKEKEDDKKDNDDIDDYNHMPEVEIVEPKVLYPLEVTEKNIRRNVIYFDYYDEDNDKMKKAGYRLYKYDDKNNKILIDEKDEITRRADMYVLLSGSQEEKFYLEVWAEDNYGNVARDSKNLKIGSFIPNVTLESIDRCYLDSKLVISVNEHDEDEINRCLKKNYLRYYVVDEENKVVLDRKGKVPNSFDISKEYFTEDRTYTICQEISNINGYKTEAKTKFYIVEIPKPIVKIDNVTLHLGQTIPTNIQIIQPQSPLKGSLPNYEYDFKDSDANFWIYDDNNKVIFEKKEIAKEISACYEMGFNESSVSRLFKLKQEVVNGAGKKGICISNIYVKDYEDSFLDIEILERDNDKLTKKDEIYTNESLDIKTTKYINGKVLKVETVIEDEEKNIVYSSNEIINGLISMPYISGKYKLKTKILYEDNKDSRKETLEDEAVFIIKEVKKPALELDLEKSIITKQDILRVKYKAYDVNKSEEHPNGFMLDTKMYLYKEGVEVKLLDSQYSNDTNMLDLDISKLNLDYSNAYQIALEAKNIEHLAKTNKVSKDFEIINIYPTIDVLKQDKYYKNEDIIVEALGKDSDGYIKSFELINIDEIRKNNIVENIIEEKTILDEKNCRLKIRIKAKEKIELSLIFQIVDDNNQVVIKKENISILDDENYSYINLLTKEKDRQKEYRYLKLSYGSMIKNNQNYEEKEEYKDKYINVLEIRKIDDKETSDNKVLKIAEDQISFKSCDIYDDINYKLVVENIESSLDNNYLNIECLAGLYFKNKGKYQIETYLVKKDGTKITNERKIVLDIQEDYLPECIINIKSSKVRDFDDKKAKIEILNLINTDDYIKNLEVYVNDEKREDIVMLDKDLENNKGNEGKKIRYVINLALFENELGKKDIKVKLNETNKYLPDSTNKLYLDLVENLKSNISNIETIEIVNLMPTLTYNLDKVDIKYQLIE